MSMKHKYDIDKMLLSMVGYKGLFYPGIFANKNIPAKKGDYKIDSVKTEVLANTSTGQVLYDKRSGFMPVKLGWIRIPYAVMTVSGKKTIVETPLVGAQGTVKELISVDDWQITIAGILETGLGIYPEDDIREIITLYNSNESVSLISAFSDIIFDYGSDKVVITDISFPPMDGCEDMQAVKIECTSDAPYELIIE